MSTTIRYREGVAIIEPTGRVVLGDGEDSLRGAIRRAVSGGASEILVDLHHVQVLDSSGIGALLAAQRAVAGRGGEIKLLRLPRRVHRLLQITEVLALFDVFDDEPSAISSFGSRTS